MKHSACKQLLTYPSCSYPAFCAILSRWPNKRAISNEKIEHSQQCNWKAGFLFSLAPRAPLRRTHPALSAHTQLNFTPPPLLLLLPLHQHLFHIFSHSSLIVRVGRTLKLASYHSQVLSDEIQVDNCGCACSRPIGGESWRPTMYFCTSSLLSLMISVNSPKW